jgi:hypothetical protein
MNIKDKVRTGFGVIAALLTTAGVARADDCTKAALAEVQAICGSHSNARFTVDLQQIGGSVVEVTCVPGGKLATENRVAVFGKGRSKAAPAAPSGFTLDPQASSWSAVAGAPATCPDLAYVLYQVSGAAPAPKAGSTSSAHARMKALHDAATMTAASVAAEKRTTVDVRQSLAAYRDAAGAYNGMVTVVPGTSTGLDSAVEETLQILGQIVVDRASAQAYQLIKIRLLELLTCDDNNKSTNGKFDHTCGVLGPLRIEDLAMARNALLGALVSDVVADVEKKADGSKAWKVALGASLSAVIGTSVVTLVARPKTVLDDSAARKILTALVTYADTDLPLDNLTPGQQAVAVAVLAYIQCLSPDPDSAGEISDPVKLLAACDVGANVVKLAGDKTAIIPAAQTLAQDLVVIATPTPKNGDVRPRVTTAVEALFVSACMVLRDQGPSATPRLECDDPPDKLTNPQDALALLQPIVVDAIEQDTNALIAAIVHALQVADAAKEPQDATNVNRVFALMGGILDYTATYTSPASGSSSDSLHDQRTKILESLTSSMTDRTGRAGDTIASLSGTLRGMFGRRYSIDNRSNHAFLGPVSLPLGFSVTHLGKSKNGCGGCGFHLELDAVDLGQYLSYDGSAKVAKPALEDALSPGVTLAVAWGSSVPFVVGVSAGYSPHFEIDPANPTHKGTFNVGLTVGLNVPLLDLN